MHISRGYYKIWWICCSLAACKVSFSQNCEETVAHLSRIAFNLYTDTLIPPEQAACTGTLFAERDLRERHPAYFTYEKLKEQNPAMYCCLVQQGFSLNFMSTCIFDEKVERFVMAYNAVMDVYLKGVLGAERFQRIFEDNTCPVPATSIREWMNGWPRKPPFIVAAENDTCLRVKFDAGLLYAGIPGYFRFTFSDKLNPGVNITVEKTDTVARSLLLSRSNGNKYFLRIEISLQQWPEVDNDCFCEALLPVRWLYVLPLRI